MYVTKFKLTSEADWIVFVGSSSSISSSSSRSMISGSGLLLSNFLFAAAAACAAARFEVHELPDYNKEEEHINITGTSFIPGGLGDPKKLYFNLIYSIRAWFYAPNFWFLTLLLELLPNGVFFFWGIIVISSDTLIGCLGFVVWLDPDALWPEEPPEAVPFLAPPLCAVYTWFSNSLYCPKVAVHTVHLYDRWAGFNTYW